MDIVAASSRHWRWPRRQNQKNFKTPEAAVQALIKAAQAKDTQALLGLLGPLAKPIIDSGDPVADKNARDNFLANYKAKNSLDKSVPDKATLNVGEDEWPFPIPVVKKDGAWYFDSAAGAEEMINRRVGENELATIQSCLAYVDAQQEYYLRNAAEGSVAALREQVHQHRRERRTASIGRPRQNEPQSPLGEEFVTARAEGYFASEARRRARRSMATSTACSRARDPMRLAAPMTTWSTASCSADSG